MLQVDSSLFANVIISVQRTSALPGGVVSGLPNGLVIEGLKGVNSFGSDVAEAQKEYELGRIRSALSRVQQIETQFSGILGRWNASAGTVLTSGRQSQQKLSLQKINEVKNAQTKMQLLAGPATKSFRDLITALEHAISIEGHVSEDETQDESKSKNESHNLIAAAEPPANESFQPSEGLPQINHPDPNLLGRYALTYRFDSRIEKKRTENNKSYLEPKLQVDQFYFLTGKQPPRVVRIRRLDRSQIIVLDTYLNRDVTIDTIEIRQLLEQGMWLLQPIRVPSATKNKSDDD
jgi:hypothetical protein